MTDNGYYFDEVKAEVTNHFNGFIASIEAGKFDADTFEAANYSDFYDKYAGIIDELVEVEKIAHNTDGLKAREAVLANKFDVIDAVMEAMVEPGELLDAIFDNAEGREDMFLYLDNIARRNVVTFAVGAVLKENKDRIEKALNKDIDKCNKDGARLYLDGIKARIREYMDGKQPEDGDDGGAAYNFLCEAVTDVFYIYYGTDTFKAELCGADLVLYGDNKALPRIVLELREYSGDTTGILTASGKNNGVEYYETLALDDDMADELISEIYERASFVNFD